jgi:hypothetical protein
LYLTVLVLLARLDLYNLRAVLPSGMGHWLSRRSW